MNKTRFQHDRMTSLRLPQEVYDRLRLIAEDRWTTISQVIRQGIRKEIEANSGLFDPDGIKPEQHDPQAD